MIDQAGILMAQGSAIACERIAGVNDNMSKSHYHEYFEIYHLEAGERIHVVNDRLYRIVPGEFVLFPPYWMHHSFGEADVGFKRIVTYFRADQVCSPALLAAVREGGGVYRPGTRARMDIHNLLEKLLAEQETPGALSEEYRQAALNMLLMLLIRTEKAAETPQMQNRISSVIAYIHSHYQEDLSLEKLAGSFYVSPYYLCREFKKYTNRTIVQYINVTRVMNAQRKFMETDKNITQISRETGFSNITHFNRVFKGVTGMTPSGYRRRVRERGEG